jgi:two-component system OmpR family response regulator
MRYSEQLRDELAPGRVGGPAASVSGASRPRLLVVDDEQRITTVLARVMQSKGFRVDCAHGGDRACELIDGRDYALVVLDLMLPGLDGFAVLRRIGEMEVAQPVLVLSARSDVESKLRCFELGATDYMTKPFSVAELLARVHARIDARRGVQRARFLGEGHLQLDIHRRTATAGGRSVRLSPREFTLLEYLMRADGRACSRQELLENVWGSGFDAQTNIVDVLVSRLRSKLGDSCIQTVRNVGYVFHDA